MGITDEFLVLLEEEIKIFVQNTFNEFKNEALEDGQSFLFNSKDDLIRWKKGLDNKSLSKADFEWLIASKKDELELISLKKIALGKVAQDRFVNGLIDIVVNTAFKTLI
jgi:hypothetical protein